LLLRAYKSWDHVCHRSVVERWPQAVDVEDVDIVGIERPEGLVQVGSHGGAGQMLGAVEPIDVAFGGDHHAVARAALDGLADDALGLVGDGCVEEIDTEVERLSHEGNGLRLGEAGAEPDAAVAAAAEAGHADLEPRLAKRGKLHLLPPWCQTRRV